MAKDHYIPAALLGRFSADSDGALRRRNLRVLSRHTEPRDVPASAIGYKKGLYGLEADLFQSSEGRAVDNLWDAYEPGLSGALDSLIDGTVTPSDWIQVLVPFVAATFARDRFYRDRVDARPKNLLLLELLKGTGVLEDKTSLNLNRLLEMNKFSARAILSDWVIWDFDGDLVIPDLGFGVILDNEFEGRDVLTLVLPIGRRHALLLTPVPERTVAVRLHDGEWAIPIDHAHSTMTASQMNGELAKFAQDFLAGTDAAVATVDPGCMTLFDPASIDEMINSWPFNISTLDAAGIHDPLEHVLLGGRVDLDQHKLDRYVGVANLDTDIDFRFVTPAPGRLASEVVMHRRSAIVARSHA